MLLKVLIVNSYKYMVYKFVYFVCFLNVVG